MTRAVLFYITIFIFLFETSLYPAPSPKQHKKGSEQKQKSHTGRHGRNGRAPDLSFLFDPETSACIANKPLLVKNLIFGIKVIPGLVLSTQAIHIKDVPYPYNASLLEDGPENYLLAFRYDIPVTYVKGQSPFTTKIGISKLDASFQPIGKVYPIDTHSEYSEDPRIFRFNKELFLFYNDLVSKQPYCRYMRLAKLNERDMRVESIISVDPHLTPVEKNWPPFEAVVDGKNTLFFSYMPNPHKVLSMINHQNGPSWQLQFDGMSRQAFVDWENTWGTIRGGTPVRLVDGEFLGFFHSFVFDKMNNHYYYVMGAYTFESQPPFRMTRISEQPITFPGMYSTPICRTADQKKSVIFPAGFVVRNRAGSQVIHVSCGENDSGVKIITLDKEKLFQTLKKVAK